MKGIILAGGRGSRLWPITKVISKQLLPVYDKPMIYYPLSTLMLSGIREIAMITNPTDLDLFRNLLGDGSKWGMEITYLTQTEPEGIAQAYLIAEEYLGSEKSTLILGDNILVGAGVGESLELKNQIEVGCKIYTYKVSDPSNFGVLYLNQEGRPLKIIEKPSEPESDRAIPGLYVFDETASSRVKYQEKSKRGELEITDLLSSYLNDNKLVFEEMERGTVWLDMGNPLDLSIASEYVRIVEQRQKFKISCPEEIAWRKKWITTEDLNALSQEILNSSYGNYLMSLLDEES